ncbi:MAG TPA: hypothetical protein VEI25_04180 [Paraburkholderia sp.]|nr:hypothetical protein [Paraburkholderia sp.]
MTTPLHRALRSIVALSIITGSVALAGCTLDPPGPAPIYSRLPADQSSASKGAPSLTPEERQRYDAIDQQVLREQDQAMAAESAAQAWYRYPAPVTVYGGYSNGGWGSGWGTGIGFGYGYAPGWGY